MTTKISPPSDLTDELRPEYNLSELKGRVRGKYARHFESETQTVVLEADVAAVFPDAKAVNRALRFLIKMTKENPVALVDPDNPGGTTSSVRESIRKNSLNTGIEDPVPTTLPNATQPV